MYVWAEDEGHLDGNPLKRLKKPVAGRREQIVTPAQSADILAHYKPADPFRALLEYCWESGARPQEARRIEVRHVDLANHRVFFPPKEAKGKRKWRVILTTPRAEEILVRRVGERADGFVFRNARGGQWTAYAVNCRFCRLKEKTGTKFALYSLRHSYCQKLLVSGVDHLTVAALMGHSDGAMVRTTYSHLDQDQDHLMAALRKASAAA